jgi:hypothetical protein
MPNEYITLKDLLITIRKFLLELKKNIFIILAFSIIFGIVGYVWKSKPVYEASALSMLKNERSAGGLFNLAASQLGLSSDENISFEKINGVGNSGYLKSLVLQSKGIVNGKEDYIINHLIEAYQLRKSLGIDDNKLVDFSRIGEKQDSIISKMKLFIESKYKIIETKDKFVEIKVGLINPELSILLTNALIINIIEYFKEISINKDLKAETILTLKKDSIREELLIAEQIFADMKDKSYHTVKSKGYLELSRAERKVKILNEIYIESLKQLEMIRFKVLNHKSNIDIVEVSVLPLKNTAMSSLKKSVIFFLLGFLLSTIFFVFRKIYLEIKHNLTI